MRLHHSWALMVLAQKGRCSCLCLMQGGDALSNLIQLSLSWISGSCIIMGPPLACHMP